MAQNSPATLNSKTRGSGFVRKDAQLCTMVWWPRGKNTPFGSHKYPPDRHRQKRRAANPAARPGRISCVDTAWAPVFPGVLAAVNYPVPVAPVRQVCVSLGCFHRVYTGAAQWAAARCLDAFRPFSRVITCDMLEPSTERSTGSFRWVLHMSPCRLNRLLPTP